MDNSSQIRENRFEKSMTVTPLYHRTKGQWYKDAGVNNKMFKMTNLLS